MQTEDELVTRAKAGDMIAFQALVELNSGKMYRAAYRILNHKEQAEDCVQEAFLKMHTKLQSFRQQSKFSTWLYSITVNEALDYRRRNTRHTYSYEYDLDQLPSQQANAPEKAVWNSNISSATEHAISLLSDDIKAAFILRHYEGRSINEISQILGVNTNTVKSRIFRGIGRLRELLHAKVGDYEAVD